MTAPAFLRRFAARGVFWRHYLDWAVRNVPHYLQPILLFGMTLFFFCLAGSVRRAAVANLRLIFPSASAWTIHHRAFRILHNFAWTITDASLFKLIQVKAAGVLGAGPPPGRSLPPSPAQGHATSTDDFTYDFVGAEHLETLAQARGAIVLTAHMGNYDLGAAIFAQKFQREIRMVRAPEADAESARHLQSSLQQSGAGAVKVDYNTSGALLSFDLLHAVRAGEIVSIQGDRVIPGLASAEVELFGQPVPLPTGPFTLALVAQVPIFPLFFVRAGYRSYRILTRAPIHLRRTESGRAEDVATGLKAWRDVLEETIATHWPQWFALVPILPTDAKS